MSATAGPKGVHIGTAGWSLSSRYLKEFSSSGTHLERYARTFPIVEITTSFYRHHRIDTYARWASSVADDFRFAVKTPQALTHEGALVTGKSEVMERFLSEVAGLGSKLRVLLVQLPPSLEFSETEVRTFFDRLRKGAPPEVSIVCEPRHESWGSSEANRLLGELSVSRAAADPPRWNADGSPGGNRRLAYYRMHGTPRIYFSDYDAARIDQFAEMLSAAAATSDEVWCIFDNTAHGHAIGNALSTRRTLNQC